MIRKRVKELEDKVDALGLIDNITNDQLKHIYKRLEDESNKRREMYISMGEQINKAYDREESMLNIIKKMSDIVNALEERVKRLEAGADDGK